MSQDRIDRIRAGYTQFGRTGETDVDFFAPDFELRQASSIIDTAGVFHGRDAVRDVMRELEESFEELSMETEELIEGPRTGRRANPYPWPGPWKSSGDR